MNWGRILGAELKVLPVPRVEARRAILLLQVEVASGEPRVLVGYKGKQEE